MRSFISKVFISVFSLAMLTACGNTPPTTPENFAVTTLSSTQISTTWNASKNHGGIDYYEVWRNSALLTQSETTGYLDTGLITSTTYCYSVRAIGDDSGEKSDFTETICDTTFPYDDIGPPTIPQNLISNALSSTKIQLFWEPSTDDLAVSGYRIYRDDVSISTALSNTYTDTGLINSTAYCYAVSAYDRLDQESDISNASCTTTLIP
jgi:chitodextrinase